MAVKLNKPILVAGVGLSFLLWLGESLHQEILAFGEWGLLGLMALGSGVWWWQQKTQELPTLKPISPLTLEDANQAIAKTQTLLDYIVKECPNSNISSLQQKLSRLPSRFNQSVVSLGLVGVKNTGKTTIKSLLNAQNIDINLDFIEIESLLIDDKNKPIISDFILFLTTGDLTESEWQIIQQLQQNHQRCLIVFNKQDQYIPEERLLILQQLQQRVKSIIPAEDVISINCIQTELKVRQYQTDGSQQEWIENQPPKIEPLVKRIKVILEEERQQLIWGNIWREAVEIKQEAKEILNQIRRDLALPLIEQYQWIAAGTAFANPVAALDLLVTAAINTQMVLDLSNIYNLKFSLAQGQTVSAKIAKVMVQLGVVELSTHAISGLLKSNAVTYVAGGVTQGISAAYLTRLAGLSLVEYFQEQDINTSGNQKIDLEKLSQKLKQVFEQTKRTELLQNLVKQAIPKLT
ncbi:DUF697 domain-containing protein [Crocosphaera sp. XPORK-15E]|uniref:slr1306 family protein n=1 Tax=Crocosphaera sp. XPORK-15E TaxID=3110247 RepID=UPI002B1F2E7F|nr:DUF697 domain-containing protein [Crocosphaera sp. XPORK-15E]MEA5533597.1 DUF697 domain-containing protein [Crocosphaera sp. XPORK-15E]